MYKAGDLIVGTVPASRFNDEEYKLLRVYSVKRGQIDTVGSPSYKAGTGRGIPFGKCAFSYVRLCRGDVSVAVPATATLKQMVDQLETLNVRITGTLELEL
jgi:hypothetical protein